MPKHVGLENNAGPTDRVDPARNRLFLTVTTALLIRRRSLTAQMLLLYWFPRAMICSIFFPKNDIFFSDLSSLRFNLLTIS